MPSPPPESKRSRRVGFAGGCLTALVAVVAIVVLMAPLSALLGPGVMIGGGLVVGGIFGFAALHYFIWGWWLDDIIERDEDERAE